MNNTVEDWLRSLGLISYTQAFLDNGYDELDICKEIGEEDLDAIGVLNRKDRADILSAVDRLNNGGTAVYFVLEQADETQVSPVQLKREKYTPLKLRMVLHEKLQEDNIDLAAPPYTNPNGSRGILEPLAKYFSDKLYAYEEEVLQALENLRDRQAGQCNYADYGKAVSETKECASSEVPAGLPNQGSQVQGKNRFTKDQEQDEDPRQVTAAKNHVNSKSQPVGSAKPDSLLDYLNVDSPSQDDQKGKRRRPVERNTKLSRSLDSLKELHVNMEPRLRDREPSSFRFMKLFHHSKKKPHSAMSAKGLSVEQHPFVNMSIQASNITMSEEDRMALMIMVKQGELTPEEAIEQWRSYEEGHAKGNTDKESEEEKHGCKTKLKRGIWSKNSKRKPSSRPGSEIIASEMTMCEEDRINLMKQVKTGEITMEEALQRLASYEEGRRNSDDTEANKQEKHFKPRSPKVRGNFAKKSIKRVSTVLSSSFRVPSKEESSSVFYTNAGGTDELETTSMDRSADSSPDSSPALVQQTAFLRSSLRKRSSGSTSSSADLPSPSFLNEIKVAVARHSEELHKAEMEEMSGSADQQTEDVNPHLKAVPLCNKYEKAPPPTPTERKQFTSFPDPQRTSDPAALPEILHRQVSVKAPAARDNLQETTAVSGESGTATRAFTHPNSTSLRVKAPKAVITKPPPLPPRPAVRKSSATRVDSERSATPDVNEHSVNTQIQPSIPKPSATTDISIPAKPSLKPKPKPKPRLKLKSSVSEEEPTGLEAQTNNERDPGLDVREREQPRPTSRDVPPKKPIPRQRHSPSLGDMVKRRLQTDDIDLTFPPYTDKDGRWGVPFNLIDRYAEEMNRPLTEIADCVEVIRRRNLGRLGREMIRYDVSTMTSSPEDKVQVHCLEAWLTSLGLPKYINSFIDVDYGDMELMPYMTEKHFEYVGVFDPRHMRRLLSAVEKLRGPDEEDSKL